MWLYSHLVVAEAVRPYLQIDDLDAYHLGATIPDIRHWVDMRRAQTPKGKVDVPDVLIK